MDGGPLTDNVVLSSDQRVLVLKRIAALRARSRADPSRDDPEQGLFRAGPEQEYFRAGSTDDGPSYLRSSWHASGQDLDL